MANSGCCCPRADAHAVSIPYPAGMALWPDDGTIKELRDQVSIPYPAGMALWLNVLLGVTGRELETSLNPLSSGDGFVALQATHTQLEGEHTVSIPYPAGMALWHEGTVSRRGAGPGVSIPYPAGMALWPASVVPAIAEPVVSIPYPAGMALWRCWCSSAFSRTAFVSIPYPAGMALWLATR